MWHWISAEHMFYLSFSFKKVALSVKKFKPNIDFLNNRVVVSICEFVTFPLVSWVRCDS